MAETQRPANGGRKHSRGPDEAGAYPIHSFTTVPVAQDAVRDDTQDAIMNQTTKTIRVFCVDDHDFLIQGLSSRLAQEDDLEFVGWATTADDLVHDVMRTEADVVLLDIEMPGRDPFAALDDLRRIRPETRVIILSGQIRDGYFDMAVAHGAWGYFSKNDATDEILEGIRRVTTGQAMYGREVLTRVGAAAPGDGRPSRVGSSKLRTLTPREQEILRMVGKGMSRADIAKHLHRSIKTIDAHHTSIMKKLDIHDRAELAVYAVQEGYH